MLFALQIRQKALNATRTVQNEFACPKRGDVVKSTGIIAKFGAFIKQKKKSKKTRTGIFHELLLAIHDRKLIQVCAIIDDLKPSFVLKKPPAAELNKVFLTAMANRIDLACVMLLEKGFPADINVPINGTADSKRKITSEKLNMPSFFLLGLSTGSEMIIKIMMKVDNVLF